MLYISSLDGIRAIAIIAVLIFHVSPKVLSGGFIGVDVFFVVSGFLITSIILHGVRDHSFSILEFYLRRFQRLLPNAIACILVVLFLWTEFMPDGAAVQPAVHGQWALFNLSNFYNWKHLGGYWGTTAERAPLTHFWSLGIEEQFYLIFPISILLLLRFQSRHLRLWLIVFTVVSFTMSLFGTYTKPSATFYFLPTRVWELLIGASLVSYLAHVNGEKTRGWLPLGPKHREIIGWVGLAMIVIGCLFIGEGVLFPGWVSLAPTLGTLFILVSITSGESSLSWLLSTWVMERIGKLSYSLYLWHWPLIVFGRRQAELYELPEQAGAIFGLIGSFLISGCAYLFIEQPLRKRGPGRSWRLAVIAGSFCFTALCCAFIAQRSKVFDANDRFDVSFWSADLFNSGAIDGAKFINPSFYDIHLPAVSPPPADTWQKGGIIHRYGGGDPNVVVFGSSHAMMFSPLINDICREKGISVAFLGMSLGQSAFFESKAGMNFSSPIEAKKFDETRKRLLSTWRPKALIIIDRWDSIGTIDQFESKLRTFLKEVCPLVDHVIFAAQVPSLRAPNDINLRALIAWRMEHMGRKDLLPRLEPDANESLRKQCIMTASAAAADYPKLQVLRSDLAFYHDNGSIRYAEGKSFFYLDTNHLTDAGTQQVRDLFSTAISEACRGTFHR